MTIFINSHIPAIEALPNVYSIEPRHDFLYELARVLNNELGDSLAISDAVIILPTKRAARALADAYLKIRDGKPAILPRIRTIGDIDPFELNLFELDNEYSLPPAINGLARRFALSKLIAARNKNLNWANDAISTLAAADSLADLLESAELTAEGDGPNWSALANLIENTELAAHWEISQEFLKIVTEVWPQILAEKNLCDIGLKKRRAIESLARNWEANPPNHPVIIAGSTGAIPANRDLMRIVSRLPMGAIVLPGLDKEIEAWEEIGFEDTHPQRTLFDTIKHIGIERANVKYWPQTNTNGIDDLSIRRMILNEALAPAEATASWLENINKIKSKTDNAIEKALNGVAIIEAKTEELEAEAIALEMRKTLETKGETCALVTPNQDIARRVAVKMQKWDIRLNISSGTNLNETLLGGFIAAVSDWLIDTGDPIRLLAMLNHPLFSLGDENWQTAHKVADLELYMLHGARKDDDIFAMNLRAQNLYNAAKENYKFQFERPISLLNKICETLETIIFETKTINDCAIILIGICEEFAKTKDGENNLWRGETGINASNFFAELIENGHEFNIKNNIDGFKTIGFLLSEVKIRPNGTHPRLAILGPLEARLLRFDKLILAGLDEKVWPKPPNPDPFLSRPMRKKLGLIAHDLRLGLSAHDFAQMAAAPNIIITRAQRRGGSPTIPSRWLWRLKTLCGDSMNEILETKQANDCLILAQSLVPEKNFNSQSAIPKPNPPIEKRPLEFSVTQFETWIRDPYKIYVNKVLSLVPLENIGTKISGKERGTAIHGGLEMIESWYEKWPENPKQELNQAFSAHFEAAGFKGQKLKEQLRSINPTTEFIANYEKSRIKNYSLKAEKWLDTIYVHKNINLKIKAKIDRIDISQNGIEIWDYKTGQSPSDKQINAMISPQIPITCIILNNTNLDFTNNKSITGFGHIKVGNKKPEAIAWGIKKPELSLTELIDKTYSAINTLIEDYYDETNPKQYISKPYPLLLKNFKYEQKEDFLARRIEWTNSIGGAE